MGNDDHSHLDAGGQFVGKYLGLPPNVVGIRVDTPRTWPALELICAIYADTDPAFVRDLRQAMRNAGWRKDHQPGPDHGAG